MGTVGSPLLQRFQTAVAHWNIQRHPRHSGAGSFWIFVAIARPLFCPGHTSRTNFPEDLHAWVHSFANYSEWWMF
uniref:Uncharacterized protein n=1 Tax=Anguilla anguilla TaxID=7936 RepID=A0A0E9Y2C9_ANGAN